MSLPACNEFVKIGIDYDAVGRGWIWFVAFYEFETVIPGKCGRDLSFFVLFAFDELRNTGIFGGLPHTHPNVLQASGLLY
jgi:hypothetical protein